MIVVEGEIEEIVEDKTHLLKKGNVIILPSNIEHGGRQMLQLEEKLLYPSTTQVAVFVSLDNAAKFSLDSMEIQVDGKRVAQHLYTVKELEALQKGGIQRIYAGNIVSGRHDLQVLLTGKAARVTALRTKESFMFSTKESFTFSKDVGPKMLEVHLVNAADKVITLKDW